MALTGGDKSSLIDAYLAFHGWLGNLDIQVPYQDGGVKGAFTRMVGS